MHEVAVEVKLPGQAEADTLAILLSEGEPTPFSDGARILDDQLKGRLRRLAENGELRGELGKTVLLHTDGELKARRVVIAGIGKLDRVDTDALRTAAAAATTCVADIGGSIGWLLDESLPLSLEEQTRAIVEGTLLGSYDPAHWKTQEKPRKKIEKIVLCTGEQGGLADAAKRAAQVAKWVNWARDLANAPPNELTPEELAARAGELSGPTVRVETRSEEHTSELQSHHDIVCRLLL